MTKTKQRDALAIILGSAFYKALESLSLISPEPFRVTTPHGEQLVWRMQARGDRDVYLFVRHGTPHTLLPHQIDWRAQAAAMDALGVGALVVTSSVGVMDASLPVQTPMLLGDLMMPQNMLPDGTACTMFLQPSPTQGHLVIEDGIFSSALNQRIREIASRAGVAVHEEEVVFAYVGGPRTKTPAENRFFAQAGAQVNSMTVGPEVVLANELEIPCAGLVTGHKRSSGEDRADVSGAAQITASLDEARDALSSLIVAIANELEPVPFANHIYRFGGGERD